MPHVILSTSHQLTAAQLPHQLPDADRAAVVQFVDEVEGSWGVRFAPGYDPELRFMAHLWEPLR